jgi:FkbM family methyltransferase
MTAVAGAGDIVIDTRNGAVEGATAHERLAIAGLRTATAMLRPLHEFGYSYVARLIRLLLPSRKSMVLRLDDDSLMRVGYCDGYWSTMTLKGYRYEPWTKALLVDSADVDCGFIDCGANFGFWSIYASSKAAGSKPTVAIEAASDTFARLDDNRLLNGDRYVALNKAIGAKSGEHVRIYGVKHEARTTVAPSADAKPILDCETITIDDVAAMPVFAGIDKFIVKLDVEGVEIPAFDGATRLLAGDGAFVYEEHGSDPTHATTRHVLENLKLRVFWLGEGERGEILSVDQLAGIKKSRRYGYDMVASASPYWIARLERLAGVSPAAR